MRFLPIAERELRVMARQNRTWWQRVLILLSALAIFAFAYINFRRWATAGMLGREMFSVLGGFSFAYALLTGPLVTVDCLSRERRDGTLGLLFLTDLHSYDVVLGKMAAASFGVVLGLIAAAPVVAIPILMGGVTLIHLSYFALAVVNVMFLSLATGTFMSSLCRSGRKSLALTVGVLLALTFAIPILGTSVFGIRPGMRNSQWFYLFCPLLTMDYALNGLRRPVWLFWVNMGGLHGLAWLCLLIACWRTATSWRDLPASVWLARWNQRLERFSKGTTRARRRWKRLMLERNPVAWLEGRHWFEPRVLWAIIFIYAAYLITTHLIDPQYWPSRDMMDALPFFSHYILCLWLAIQAPRRLADDKQSGALELLLCTPATPKTIVRGTMSILRRRFGLALLALLMVDLFLIYSFFDVNGGWREFWKDDCYKLIIGGALVFPLQVWSLARVGLYQGLAQSSSLRATFMVAWKIGVLPLVLWFTFMMTSEALGLLNGVSDTFILSALACAHIFTCLFFLAHASWNLHWNFRRLAAQSVKLSLWKRLRGWRH
jgi:ABC-type transport system involved in multi-copper enzyme maturation permease subunit